MSHEPKKTALALLSSGLDSTVAMAMAIQEGYQIALALTLDYGQRAVSRELMHAGWIADYYKVPHKALRLSWFSELKRSQLLKKAEPLPAPSLSDLDNLEKSKATAKAVWVPNRNGVFIEIAASYAEELGIEHVLTGFNKEEAATFPDNTQEYLDAINKALSFSTQSKVSVFSPTSALDKNGIVRAAKELRAPLDLLWSCYESKLLMCGDCESCMRLKRALHTNGVSIDSRFANPKL